MGQIKNIKLHIVTDIKISVEDGIQGYCTASIRGLTFNKPYIIKVTALLQDNYDRVSSNEIIFSLPLPESLTSYVTSLEVIDEEEGQHQQPIQLNIFEDNPKEEI